MPGFTRMPHPLLVLLEDDIGRAAILECLGKLDADTAIAADDDVVLQLIDFRLHAPPT
jgi:ethanolamine utilization protein EutA (predicted chaperonin)